MQAAHGKDEIEISGSITLSPPVVIGIAPNLRCVRKNLPCPRKALDISVCRNHRADEVFVAMKNEVELTEVNEARKINGLEK